MDKRLTPFHDKQGILHFPYRPLRDVAFIWPTPPPNRFKNTIIEIPADYKQSHQDGTGILLAIGPGYYSQDGKYHPTSSDLKVGVKVHYDKSVPWFTKAIGQDGKEYVVVMCGAQDIHGIFISDIIMMKMV